MALIVAFHRGEEQLTDSFSHQGSGRGWAGSCSLQCRLAAASPASDSGCSSSMPRRISERAHDGFQNEPAAGPARACRFPSPRP